MTISVDLVSKCDQLVVEWGRLPESHVCLIISLFEQGSLMD